MTEAPWRISSTFGFPLPMAVVGDCPCHVSLAMSTWNITSSRQLTERNHGSYRAELTGRLINPREEILEPGKKFDDDNILQFPIRVLFKIHFGVFVKLCKRYIFQCKVLQKIFNIVSQRKKRGEKKRSHNQCSATFIPTDCDPHKSILSYSPLLIAARKRCWKRESSWR